MGRYYLCPILSIDPMGQRAALSTKDFPDHLPTPEMVYLCQLFAQWETVHLVSPLVKASA